MARCLGILMRTPTNKIDTCEARVKRMERQYEVKRQGAREQSAQAQTVAAVPMQLYLSRDGRMCVAEAISNICQVAQSVHTLGPYRQLGRQHWMKEDCQRGMSHWVSLRMPCSLFGAPIGSG